MTPILFEWCVLRLGWPHLGVDPSYHLAGIVLGHPRLADQHQIVTSPIQLLAADESWARTMSRYYLLKDRLPHAIADRIRRYEVFKISIRFGIAIEAIDFDVEWPGPRPRGPIPATVVNDFSHPRIKSSLGGGSIAKKRD